jgi:hypothetical protein
MSVMRQDANRVVITVRIVRTTRKAGQLIKTYGGLGILLYRAINETVQPPSRTTRAKHAMSMFFCSSFLMNPVHMPLKTLKHPHASMSGRMPP